MDEQKRKVITDLMLAASRGDLTRVEALLRDGADVNARDSFGYSALLYAASAGHIAVAEALIDAGADVALKNQNGKSGIDLASAKGHPAVAALLRHAQFFIAARDGDLASVNRLLDQGVDANVRLRDEWTALMIATLHNRPQVVSALLRRGAYVDAQNAAGWTALMIAERKGYADVERLLKYGNIERPMPSLIASDLVSDDGTDMSEFPAT